MFCPNGFVPFSRVIDSVSTKPFDYMEVAKSWVGDVGEGGEVPDRFFVVGPMDWAEFSMFGFFSDDLCLSSPRGDLVRFDVRAIRSVFDFIEFNVLDAFSYAEFPSALFKQQLLFDLPPKDFRSEYQRSASVHPWLFAERQGLDGLHLTISMWLERVGYTMNFDAFDFFHDQRASELTGLEGVIGNLRRFEGWAFCVSEEMASKKTEALRSQHIETIEARERLTHAAAEKEAFRFLNGVLSEGDWNGTKEELRRKLPFRLGERAWGRVFSDLRKEHPKISTPGRRPRNI